MQQRRKQILLLVTIGEQERKPIVFYRLQIQQSHHSNSLPYLRAGYFQFKLKQSPFWPRLLLMDHFHAKLGNRHVLHVLREMRVASTTLLGLSGLLLVSPSHSKFHAVNNSSLSSLIFFAACTFQTCFKFILVSALNVSHRCGPSRADNNSALSLTFCPTFL